MTILRTELIYQKNKKVEMDKQTFRILYKDTVDALDDRRLSDALNALGGMLSCLGNWEYEAELTDIRKIYGLLLDCMSQGAADPDRDNLFRQFCCRTYELTEKVCREFELREGDSQYAAVWRTLQKLSGVRCMEELNKGDAGGRRLFELVWTSPLWSRADWAAAQTFLSGNDRSEVDKCLLLSAVTLATLSYPDINKLKFLLENVSNEVPVLRVRAMVGGILSVVRYSRRLRLYPEVMAQLQLLADVPGFMADLSGLQMQLILSLETKEIEKSLREDIIPEVMKKARNLKLDKSLGPEELKEKMVEMDLNPEWEQDGTPSELGRKMRQLAEMHRKGADVFLGSFKLLKQRFPFFSSAVNWFYPFTPEHPELSSSLKESLPMLGFVLENGNLCDSDKYSFCLMLETLPLSQREMMAGGMAGQMGEGMSLSGMEEEKDVQTLTLRLIRSYVQDLYRYFKLYRHREEQNDPFGCNLLLTDYPPFDEIFSADRRVLAQLADFVFNEKNYLQALRLYEQLLSRAEREKADNNDMAALAQKLGFCYRQAGDYDRALAVYEKASLLRPDSFWTLEQLASCYKAKGDYVSAARMYEEMERYRSEDAMVLLRLGECYMRMERYGAALEKLHKADYLDGDSRRVQRALAWCSLLAGKVDGATRHYARLLSGDPTATDYLNAGHAAWIEGDVPCAVSRYRASLQTEGQKFAPAGFFAEDADLLLRHGKSPVDLKLMVDILNRPPAES